MCSMWSVPLASPIYHFHLFFRIRHKATLYTRLIWSITSSRSTQSCKLWVEMVNIRYYYYYEHLLHSCSLLTSVSLSLCSGYSCSGQEPDRCWCGCVESGNGLWFNLHHTGRLGINLTHTFNKLPNLRGCMSIFFFKISALKCEFTVDFSMRI